MSGSGLTGHLDPIDGRYHWQGMVFDALPDDNPPQRVRLTVGERTADARIAERTPWGTYSVVGVGDAALRARRSRVHPAGPVVDRRRQQHDREHAADDPRYQQRQSAVGSPQEPCPQSSRQHRETAGALEHSLRAGLQIRADQR